MARTYRTGSAFRSCVGSPKVSPTWPTRTARTERLWEKAWLQGAYLRYSFYLGYQYIAASWAYALVHFAWRSRRCQARRSECPRRHASAHHGHKFSNFAIHFGLRRSREGVSIGRGSLGRLARGRTPAPLFCSMSVIGASFSVHCIASICLYTFLYD